MQITLGELTFDVTVRGPERAPTALLLHGFPQTARAWDAVGVALAERGVRTAAVNQRGYSPGARPREVAAYRLPHLVEDAVGFVDRVGSGAPVVVVGHDWGAVVAWALAAARPDLVSGLVALSVPHPRAYAAALASDADQQQRARYIGLFRKEGTAEKTLLADGAQRLRGMLSDAGEAGEAYLAHHTQPGALTAALAWYRAMSTSDLADVGAVSVPTSFVWGAQDMAIARAGALGCAEWVSGPYQFVELPEAGHWLPEQHPQATVDAVAEVLRTAEGL